MHKQQLENAGVKHKWAWGARGSAKSHLMEIMLAAMEEAYKNGGAADALKVASYLHPKMQAVDASGADGKLVVQRGLK